MAREFTIECTGCHKDIVFVPDDVDGLDDYIEAEAEDRSEKDDAADYDEVRSEVMDQIGAGAPWCSIRPLQELACAVRLGNRAEAELLLDRIAAQLGVDAEEQVAFGRNVLAKRAA